MRMPFALVRLVKLAQRDYGEYVYVVPTKERRQKALEALVANVPFRETRPTIFKLLNDSTIRLVADDAPEALRGLVCTAVIIDEACTKTELDAPLQ